MICGPRPGPRSLLRRALDNVRYRVANERALRSRACDAIVAATRRAIAQRGIQLLEMEEAFGWPRGVALGVIPVVVRLHGPWFLNGTVLGLPQDATFRRRVCATSGRRSSGPRGWTASSRDVLERTRAYYGVALEDVEAIPPPAPVVTEADRWSPAGCETGLVVFVGRFDRHKGGDIVLDAFAEVARRCARLDSASPGRTRGCGNDAGRTWSIEGYFQRLPGAVESGRVEWLGQRPAANSTHFASGRRWW